MFDSFVNNCFRTYTNDANFEDIDVDEASMALEEEIAMVNEKDVEAEHYGDEETSNDNIELSGRGKDGAASNAKIVRYNPEDIQDHNSLQFVEIENVARFDTVAVLSEYSGEMSFFHPPVIQEIDEMLVADLQGTSVESMDRQWSHSSRDDGDTIRKPPKNSTSVECTSAESTARHLSRSSRDSGCSGIRQNIPPMSSTSVACTSAESAATHLSRSSGADRIQKNSAPKKSVPITKSKVTATTVSSNEESMDAVRQKLDSCITSLSTKISEKQHRSPHAPFLAYLGTKLPNVSIEQLPALEKKILDLVDLFSE